MPQPFKLVIARTTSMLPETCAGTFGDDLWSRLMYYLEYAGDLWALSRPNMTVGYHLRWNAETGALDQTWELPDPEWVSAVLLRLRPFVLKGEPTNFLKVCKALKRTIPSPLFRESVDGLRDLFLDRDFLGQVVISANDVVVNSEDLLDRWLNAYEYHRDRDKRAELRPLEAVIPAEGMRAIFISMMIDKAKAVLALARIIHGFKVRNGYTQRVGVPSDRTVGGTIHLIEP